MADQDNRPPNPDPDAEALAAFRAGTPGAFESLMDRHQGRIFRLAWRILGDRESALDAAQESFVKAWKALGGFQQKARFSTWLTRIAINQCRNELRRRGTVKHTRPLSLDEPALGTLTPRIDSVAGHEAGAWEVARGTELRSAFAEVMRALEPEAREVLILTEVEALSYEGIAELLDVPVGTVRSRLHRARADVRRRMASVLGVEHD
ncbi:MAG: sigma-70 family RNA polymerase sigma factor [Planctomycetota bacterium]|nr:sigma-70 family RNA polymerase sigma factor [Planctomycetota bacterium]